MSLNSLKPALTVKQIERLSNIFDNAGQVVFGLMVLAPLISEFDRVNLVVLLLCIVITISCWFLSIWLSRRTKWI